MTGCGYFGPEVAFDRQMDNGYSRGVRAYRRALMAAKMAIAAPGGQSASAEWMRLALPQSAFALVADWLAQGVSDRFNRSGPALPIPLSCRPPTIWPTRMVQTVQHSSDYLPV